MQLPPAAPAPLAGRQLWGLRTLRRAYPDYLPHLRYLIIHYDLYIHGVTACPH